MTPNTVSVVDSDYHVRMLIEACCVNNVDIVKRILNFRVNINSQSESYSRPTLLHCASGTCSIEVMKVLLENGANTEIYSLECVTALYCAVLYAVNCENHIKAVKLLLDYDANPIAYQNDDISLLELSINMSMIVISKLLLNSTLYV